MRTFVITAILLGALAGAIAKEMKCSGPGQGGTAKCRPHPSPEPQQNRRR